MREPPMVYVVDDDAAVRDSLAILFASAGLDCAAYSSALEFLEHYDSERHSCLVADIRMPGCSGFELQQRLSEQGATMPVIFVTGWCDTSTTASGIAAGVSDILQKPLNDQELIDRIQKALLIDIDKRAASTE